MVTDSDNRIRLAPVSECVHSTALVGDGFPHFIARGFCIRRWRACCRRRPQQRTIRRETSGPSMKPRTDLRSGRAKRKKLN